MKNEIVGFMPSFNLYSQGYPFLETIYSTLNVCDKLYIVDGSTDSTAAILNRLSKNKRILVHKKEWKLNKINTKKGWIISDLSNYLLKLLSKETSKSSYAFYVQANEVIHEDTYDFFRSVPEIYPNYKAYLFCYNNLYHKIISSTQFRLKFAPLSSNPFVFSDGWTMSIKRKSPELLIRNLKLSLYYLLAHGSLYDGLWSNWEDYAFVYSPKPIFRYTRFFMDNVREKIKMHAALFKNYNFDRVLDDESNFKDWKKLYRNEMGEDTYENKRTISAKEHPKVMQGLINKSKYQAREGLIEEIINL